MGGRPQLVQAKGSRRAFRNSGQGSGQGSSSHRQQELSSLWQHPGAVLPTASGEEVRLCKPVFLTRSQVLTLSIQYPREMTKMGLGRKAEASAFFPPPRPILQVV